MKTKNCLKFNKSLHILLDFMRTIKNIDKNNKDHGVYDFHKIYV